MNLKDVQGYEGVYKVSDCGKVVRVSTSKVLKNMKQSNGSYYYVVLSINGYTKNFRVHRLVAQAFCKKEPGHTQVNHIDCNKFNNHYSNLEWCTASENNKHAYDNGLNKPPLNFLGKFGKDHNKSKAFKFKDLSGKITEYGSGLEFNRKTGYDPSSISKARCSGVSEHKFARGKMKGCTAYFE